MKLNRNCGLWMLAALAVALLLGAVACSGSSDGNIQQQIADARAHAGQRTATPATAIDLGLLDSHCPATLPIEVNAARRIYTPSDRGYSTAAPVRCYDTLEHALHDGNLQVAGSPTPAAALSAGRTPIAHTPTPAAAATATTASPIDGGCPVDWPVKVASSGLAYDPTQPDYATISAVSCYRDLATARLGGHNPPAAPAAPTAPTAPIANASPVGAPASVQSAPTARPTTSAPASVPASVPAPVVTRVSAPPATQPPAPVLAATQPPAPAATQPPQPVAPQATSESSPSGNRPGGSGGLAPPAQH
jgi:hypothetical protein